MTNFRMILYDFIVKWALVVMGVLASVSSLASPGQLTYQGRIVRSDGTPLESSNVSFIFQITNPSGSCIIYQELITGYSMVNSSGVFDVAIGTGSIQYPLGGTVGVLDVFDNTKIFTCGSCSLVAGTYVCADGSSTYTASTGDIRKLRVSFYDGSGWQTISPDNVIRSVPFAGYSLSAQKLGAYSSSDFLIKAGLPTCTAGTFLTWDGSSLSCSAGSGTGGGTVTAVSSANSYLSVANGTSTPALTVNVGQTANTVAAGNDSRIVNAIQSSATVSGGLSGTLLSPTVSKIQGVSVSGTAPSSTGQVLRWNGASWTPNFVSMFDLRSTITGAQAFGGVGCTAGQTLTWTAATDNLSCTNIAISSSQITYSSQTANTFLAAPNGSAGSPTFRAITSADLPSGTLSGSGTSGYVPYYSSSTALGNSSLYYDGTNVGIGTTNPARLLHVNGPIRVTASALPGTPATGDVAVDSGDSNKLKWYDGSGWQAAGNGITGAVNLSSASYTVTASDNGKAFYYSNNASGVINLPALSSVSNGFSITIHRQVSQSLTITPNGSDKFPAGISSIEMQGKNLQSATIMKLGSLWALTNQTDDCTVGKDCWTADSSSGMTQIYAGTYKGHQYFTTPGGCTDSSTPTCAGGTDSVMKAWANNSGTTANGIDAIATDDMEYGAAQSAALAANYTDTDAAKFCENMVYAGYSDWYLPAKEELVFITENKATLGGFSYTGAYWASTEAGTGTAWYRTLGFGTSNYYTKTTAYYVRCVRRF